MTSKFTNLTGDYFVAPQLSRDDIRAAAADGFALIVNNRPDGEMIGQPKSAELEAAAREAGVAYAHIPVGSEGITHGHIEALHAALEKADGRKILGFCKSGVRSTFLHAYAAAAKGRAASEIIAEAASAGIDISAHAPILERLSHDATKDDQ